MARQALVVDASVVVKWFSAAGEAYVSQAVEIMEGHVSDEIAIVIPDLLYYEVANALVHKKALSDKEIQFSMQSLFHLGLESFPVDADLMGMSAELARKLKITIYDACYAAVSRINNIPLVTANPRHQIHALGCEVIPLEQWGKR